MTVELSRMIRVRPLPPQRATVDANDIERTALARRFNVIAIESLHAEVELAADGAAVDATGRLTAEIVQSCAVSDEHFPVHIDEPLALRFVPEARRIDPDEEAELPGDEPDEIEFTGDGLDLGEAVAQTLGLAIDPYAEGPNADAVRREAGIVQEGEAEGPLAELLRGLKPN